MKIMEKTRGPKVKKAILNKIKKKEEITQKMIQGETVRRPDTQTPLLTDRQVVRK